MRDPEIDGVTEQHRPAFVDGAEAPRHGLRGDILGIDAVHDFVEREGRKRPIDRRTRRLDRVALAAEFDAMPQPTSKPGQTGGKNGPTRPTNLPLLFSSTTNMPKPCSTQCPAMIAALRQPAIGSVTGLRSAVMKRALSGSPSIAILAAMSAARHCRSNSRSVSIPGQLGCGGVAPVFSGGIILLSSSTGKRCRTHITLSARLPAKYGGPA